MTTDEMRATAKKIKELLQSRHPGWDGECLREALKVYRDSAHFYASVARDIERTSYIVDASDYDYSE